ncbi:MAG: hypothetical protein Q7J78_04440 [Clostridiales bacterium]|nr:hypothetical protein [Clostridiales bacterium]
MDNPPGAWITYGQRIDNGKLVAYTLPTPLKISGLPISSTGTAATILLCYAE